MTSGIEVVRWLRAASSAAAVGAMVLVLVLSRWIWSLLPRVRTRALGFAALGSPREIELAELAISRGSPVDIWYLCSGILT